MKSFNLTKERKARIWFHELPPTFRSGFPACSQVVECKGSLRPLRTGIACELFIPLGGRFLYGLLGIQSSGVEVQQTTIEIANFPRHQTGEISDSLAGTLDTVVPWINDEYHVAILAGASTAAGKYAVLPESIRICAGRQGLIGSSPDVFRRLAFICVTLLATPEEDIGRKIEELVSLG